VLKNDGTSKNPKETRGSLSAGIWGAIEWSRLKKIVVYKIFKKNSRRAYYTQDHMGTAKELSESQENNSAYRIRKELKGGEHRKEATFGRKFKLKKRKRGVKPRAVIKKNARSLRIEILGVSASGSAYRDHHALKRTRAFI